MNESPITWRRLFPSLIIGILVLIGSFVLSRQSVNLSRFSTLGYLGVFLATLFGSATLFFPVPNVATILAAGKLFNPYWVALAGGLGSTVGEVVGYLVGSGGGSVGESSKWRPRIEHWVSNYGDLTIFLLALIPNPFFDLAGLTAGIIRFPVYRFLFATFCGKTLRAFVLAYLGSTTI